MANEYPSTDIVGHYYVSGDRSNGDKTVLDTGMINAPLDSSSATSILNYMKYFHQTIGSTVSLKDY